MRKNHNALTQHNTHRTPNRLWGGALPRVLSCVCALTLLASCAKPNAQTGASEPANFTPFAEGTLIEQLGDGTLNGIQLELVDFANINSERKKEIADLCSGYFAEIVDNEIPLEMTFRGATEQEQKIAKQLAGADGKLAAHVDTTVAARLSPRQPETDIIVALNARQEESGYLGQSDFAHSADIYDVTNQKDVTVARGIIHEAIGHPLGLGEDGYPTEWGVDKEYGHYFAYNSYNSGGNIMGSLADNKEQDEIFNNLQKEYVRQGAVRETGRTPSASWLKGGLSTNAFNKNGYTLGGDTENDAYVFETGGQMFAIANDKFNLADGMPLVSIISAFSVVKNKDGVGVYCQDEYGDTILLGIANAQTPFTMPLGRSDGREARVSIEDGATYVRFPIPENGKS
jgi:hypothetical protein